MPGLVEPPRRNGGVPSGVARDATVDTCVAPWIKFGAFAGLSSVMLGILMSQPRIFYTMSRDGLLPPLFSRLHPRFRTPHISSALVGTVCALLAGFFDVSELGHLVSIGTLLAFCIVCGGVWYLRVKEPNRPRPFKTPFVPLFPILGIASCLYLMTGLPREAWTRLFIWLALGMVIYFLYGRVHSVVQRTGDEAHGGLQEPPRPTYTDDKDGV